MPVTGEAPARGTRPTQSWGCRCFQKRPRTVAQLTLHWQPQQPWCLLSSSAFQGATRGSGARRLWRSPASSLLPCHSRSAPDMLGSCCWLTYRFSWLVLASLHLHVSVTKHKCVWSAGAVCQGPLCLRVCCPPAGWWQRCCTSSRGTSQLQKDEATGEAVVKLFSSLKLPNLAAGAL